MFSLTFSVVQYMPRWRCFSCNSPAHALQHVCLRPIEHCFTVRARVICCLIDTWQQSLPQKFTGLVRMPGVSLYPCKKRKLCGNQHVKLQRHRVKLWNRISQNTNFAVKRNIFSSTVQVSETIFLWVVSEWHWHHLNQNKQVVAIIYFLITLLSAENERNLSLC